MSKDCKALVERDWIRLFDSVEPLEKPLHILTKYERVKDYLKEYHNRPEIKAKKKEYDKKYNLENKAKKKEYNRKYYLNKIKKPQEEK